MSWDQVETYNDDSPNAPLPGGWYLCEVARAETREARTGQPYINLGMKVAEGEHSGKWTWDKLFPQGKEGAKRRLKTVYLKLGIELRGKDRPEDYLEDLLGTRIWVEVERDGEDSGPTFMGYRGEEEGPRQKGQPRRREEEFSRPEDEGDFAPF